jgi:hypothetical protein
MSARVDNSLLFQVGPAFRAGSGLSIEQECELFQTLMAFLRQHGLVDTKRVDALGEIRDGYELRRLDVTEEGWEFFGTGVERWLMAIDRGRPATDTSILTKYLAKLRGGRGSQGAP